jgi:cytochrome c oxidase assembly protein subunit 15
VIFVWFVAAIVGGRTAGSLQAGLTRGVLSGVIASAIGSLLLGAVSQQLEKMASANGGEKPSLPMMLGGFLLLGAILGGIGGAIGGTLSGSGRQGAAPSSRDWLARFALTVVAIAAPLLFVGGLVTSTASGMAVPDWPNTYGTNMFLYPLGTAGAGVFLEHSHRLFGTFLGLGALVLMIWTLRVEDRKRVRVIAVAVFAAIVLQGLLGGIRVWMGDKDLAKDNRYFSMVHGIFAQGIFALLVALWVMLTPGYRNATADPEAASGKKLRVFSAAALHTTLLQMVFGAMYRHLRSSHALWSHAGFSLAVVVIAPIAGFLAIRQREGANGPSGPLKHALSRAGMVQVGAVLLQFLLGWAALGMGGSSVEAANPAQAIVRTIHQANGAVLLGTCVTTMVLARALVPRRSTAAK